MDERHDPLYFVSTALMTAAAVTAREFQESFSRLNERLSLLLSTAPQGGLPVLPSDLLSRPQVQARLAERARLRLVA